jgi:cytochrome P450
MSTSVQGSRTDAFAASLAEARAAAPEGPDMLVPHDGEVLWSPRPPSRTERRLRLPVGSQRMTIWHVSTMKAGRQFLSARSKQGPDDPDGRPALSTAFEPPPLRWLRRHTGLVGAVLGRHPNYGGFWMLDEPRLGRARELVMAPFRPPAVEQLDALVERTAREVLDEHLARDRDRLDVADYSSDVVFRLMAYLLGADPAGAPALGRRFGAWVHRFNESPSLAALDRQPDIYRGLARMIRQHDGTPGVLADVQAAWRRGDDLGGKGRATLADYVLLLWALVFAGTDTPITAAAQTVWFARQHGSYQQLADRPVAARAVAEALRYYPPFPKPLMHVTRDVPLPGGAVARAGEWIELHLPAMNRDPEMFVHPHVYDPGRPDAAGARTFGGGAHRCLGNHYGVRIDEHLLVTLSERLPGLAPLPGHPYTRQAGLLHRIESLPMATGAATRAF